MKCGDLLSKKGWTDNADLSTNEAGPPAPSAAPGKVKNIATGETSQAITS